MKFAALSLVAFFLIASSFANRQLTDLERSNLLLARLMSFFQGFTPSKNISCAVCSTGDTLAASREDLVKYEMKSRECMDYPEKFFQLW
ncbi:hypothetical protein Ciccas_000511 [Cichlidogyrus casuarinus]|uniref:Uncharacterized protein n=1 Tax=Cichlidogyrus casuarinus TaxID=1844966 RepID=A0ABD2QMY5_9PLAT